MILPSLKEIKEDFLNNTFLEKIEQNNMHPQDVHIGLNFEQLFTRIILENNTSSTFYDNFDYETSLYLSICKNYEQIKESLFFLDDDERFEIKATLEKNYYGLNQDMNGLISKVKTKTITTVLEKQSKTPYGMKLITIYPNVSNNYSKNLNDDLKEHLKNSEGYLRSNSITRLYYEIAIDKNKPCSLLTIGNKVKRETEDIPCELLVNDKLKYQAVIAYNKIYWNQVRKIKIDGGEKWKPKDLLPPDVITLHLNYSDFAIYIQNMFSRLQAIKREVQLDRARFALESKTSPQIDT